MKALLKLSGYALFDFKSNRLNRPVFKWHYSVFSFILWLFIWPVLWVEFLGILKIFDQFRRHTRQLTKYELAALKLVFKNSVIYQHVRVKEHSKFAKMGAKFTKAPHLGFVFLNTIHFSRQINANASLSDMAWLVHEVVHVSQFQKVGIIYIIKALRAQRNGGYFYDESWLDAALKDFNFEQQAEIAKHFF
jgi:hypothetical protein